ncbi:uncharacterized protein LOC108676639 [Hyalella azteca]|uniref:Uncharacterized protein LOC108676639 n=1 Tax=Hyalella azteca TaxID=294128 RepID=A0A8B7P2A7_HYAAZ|nr:uncharacterized protein LOC108676639 [Hyalella azteca]
METPGAFTHESLPSTLNSTLIQYGPYGTSGTEHTLTPPEGPRSREALLHFTFPSQEDTLAYVDALKHSDLSQWRSLEEVAARAGGGSCSGTVSTSMLTALYLLGLFNLCTTSPNSCCIPPAASRRRRNVVTQLPPLLDALHQNLTTVRTERWPPDLPHLSPPEHAMRGGVVPLHLGVVEQVRQLWNSNPRLLSNVACRTATESVRSSFISLSGVASGIILAYSVAQLKQCYPDFSANAPDASPNIWFFPLPKPEQKNESKFLVPSLPSVIPVPGDDEPSDGCERSEVMLEDGRCAPLLSTLHCPYQHWVLLNKDTSKGECVPRLCGDGRVYVERDELCHDVNEHGICAHSQRLYLDAFGKAVCDCPDGMYHGPGGRCYTLFDPAYCAHGTVLQFHQASKTLMCGQDPCGHVNSNLWPEDLPFAPREDGFCYQFNEQGPCGVGERFGFNTESLRAACVSLIEAGIVRPKRSYLYHHMSYPSISSHPSQHYQVSYVVVNGSTWGLEVKGIGRDRRRSRDVSDEDADVKKVPFIDTRRIPRKLETLLSGVYSTGENIAHALNLDCDEYDDDLEYDDCEQLMNEASYVDENSDGFLNDPKYVIEARESHFTKNWDDPMVTESGKASSGAEILSNEVTVTQTSAAPLSEKHKKRQLVQELMRFSQESLESDIHTPLVNFPATLNSSEMSILNPLLSASELFGRPLNISSPTESPVDSTLPTLPSSYIPDPSTAESIIKRHLTPRLRIVDTLSHPRRLKQPERRVGHAASVNSGIFRVTPTIEDNSRNSLSYHLDKVLPEVNAGEVLRVDQNAGQLFSSSTPSPAELGSSSQLGVLKVDQSLLVVPEHSSIPSAVPISTTQTTTMDSFAEKATTRRRGDITVVTHRSRRRKSRRNRRRKHPPRRHKPRRRRQKIKVPSARKNPNLPKKVPVSIVSNFSSITTDQSTGTMPSPETTEDVVTPTSAFTKSEISEYSISEFTITSETNFPSFSSIYVDTPLTLTTLGPSTDSESPVEHVTTVPIESPNLKTTSKKPTQKSRRNRFGSRHKNATTQRTGGGRPSLSLTDLWRHRDRRQLTGGGGIIQAPLLSACKPGAKRDYNYKCRPKFIPQQRSTDSSDKKETAAAPVPPRIKCPTGTHLDPRGKCQATSNILG